MFYIALSKIWFVLRMKNRRNLLSEQSEETYYLGWKWRNTDIFVLSKLFVSYYVFILSRQWWWFFEYTVPKNPFECGPFGTFLNNIRLFTQSMLLLRIDLYLWLCLCLIYISHCDYLNINIHLDCVDFNKMFGLIYLFLMAFFLQ